MYIDSSSLLSRFLESSWMNNNKIVEQRQINKIANKSTLDQLSFKKIIARIVLNTFVVAIVQATSV